MSVAYKTVIHSLARSKKFNFITEENFYILRWLYRIRKANCNKGIPIGFLQPDFLWVIYRPMMQSKKLWRTNADIKEAANFWCFNSAKAKKEYGHISDWDVSSVTDMSEVFGGFHSDGFNNDISKWDVSNVTNMERMFVGAECFNQAIGNWNVSKVTNMSEMFRRAEDFDKPIGDWDVSNVTNMSGMFYRARSFNQAIENWNVSKVTNMSCMFSEVAFKSDLKEYIKNWDVSNVVNNEDMFGEEDWYSN